MIAEEAESLRWGLDRRALRWLLGTAVSLLIVYAALIPYPREDGHLLSTDGGYYYSYMASVFLDGDLDVTNEIDMYNRRLAANSPFRLHEELFYVFAIGPPILWSPAFLATHGVVIGLRGVGVDVAADGFSYPEEAAVAMTGIIYSVVGLALTYKLLTRFFGRGAALSASFVAFFASSTIYYVVFEPAMSHPVELFSVALFLWSLLGRDKSRSRDWLWAGLAAGLMSIVRWQNAVFLLLLPFELVRMTRRQSSETVYARLAKRGSLILSGLLPIALLQMLFWKSTLGSFITVPQGSGFMTWGQPHIWSVLFSTRHGLFSWTPIALIAVAGLALLKDRRLAGALATIFVLDVYVSSVAADWWGGTAFGMRRLIGLVPIFALGLAAIADQLRSSRVRKAAAGVAAALVIWNFAFVLQFRARLVPQNEALTFRQMVTDKFLLPVALLRKIL